MLTSWLLLFIFWKTNLTSSLAFHFLSIDYRNGHDWTLAHLSSIFSSKLSACFFMFSLLAASLFYYLPRLSPLIHFPLLFLTGQFLLVFRNRCFRKLSLTPRPPLKLQYFSSVLPEHLVGVLGAACISAFWFICLYNPSIFWYHTELFEIRDYLTYSPVICRCSNCVGFFCCCLLVCLFLK